MGSQELRTLESLQALQVNLDSSIYGSFAEIGAGQEAPEGALHEPYSKLPKVDNVGDYYTGSSGGYYELRLQVTYWRFRL